MIESLIVICVILLIFGVLVWAIATYLPIENPWKGLIIVIVVVIAVLLCLNRLGVVAV